VPKAQREAILRNYQWQSWLSLFFLATALLLSVWQKPNPLVPAVVFVVALGSGYSKALVPFTSKPWLAEFIYWAGFCIILVFFAVGYVEFPSGPYLTGLAWMLAGLTFPYWLFRRRAVEGVRRIKGKTAQQLTGGDAERHSTPQS